MDPFSHFWVGFFSAEKERAVESPEKLSLSRVWLEDLGFAAVHSRRSVLFELNYVHM